MKKDKNSLRHSLLVLGDPGLDTLTRCDPDRLDTADHDYPRQVVVVHEGRDYRRELERGRGGSREERERVGILDRGRFRSHEGE